VPKNIYIHGLSETDLKQEESIVWLKDRANYRYLREEVRLVPAKQRKPNKDLLAHAIAYSVLKPDAKPAYPGEFNRRIWYYYQRDEEGLYADDGLPAEGVLTTSIKPGEYSEY
jgi:hypothetical protein